MDVVFLLLTGLEVVLVDMIHSVPHISWISRKILDSPTILAKPIEGRQVLDTFSIQNLHEHADQLGMLPIK